MLAWTTGLPDLTPDLTGYAEGEPVLAGLADLYAQALDRALQDGPPRRLASVTEAAPVVRGKVLLAPTLRQPPARQHKPVTRRAEWRVDTPVNQLLKQAARVALTLDPPTPARRRLDHALTLLSDVADTSHTETAFEQLVPTRQEEGVGPALALARWLITGAAPALDVGERLFAVFRLDLARLFEQFVAALLQTRLAEAQVWPQRGVPLDQAGQFVVRPDLVVEREGQPPLVLDTKYKSPTPTDPADIYQLLTYCQALGARRAALVYPVPVDTPPLDTVAGEVTLAFLGLDLGAPPAQFADVVDAFVARVRA